MTGTPAAEKEGEEKALLSTRALIEGIKGREVKTIDPNDHSIYFDLDFQGDDPKPDHISIVQRAGELVLEVGSKHGFYKISSDVWSKEMSDDEWDCVWFQAGTHDFDGDGTDEIVFACSYLPHNIEVLVIKFFPVRNPKHFAREGNWQVFGPFCGECVGEAVVNKLQLFALRSGEHEEWIWVRDKFVHFDGLSD